MFEVQIPWTLVIAIVAVIAIICVSVMTRRKREEVDVRHQALRVLMATSSVPTMIALATSNSLSVCVALVCWCIVAIKGFEYLFRDPVPRTK
jgi:predicted membrane channel-forming protein YqfA (hemolysin III family)